MNWDRVQGEWKQFTGKAKEQWGKLTDDDLGHRRQRDQLVGKIQQRYGCARDDADKRVSEWERRLDANEARH
ncbi:MAG: CsbD family protein [Rubrivivax sp.]